MNRIHHINLVVTDLDLATHHFEKLTGVRAQALETLPKRQVALRRFRLDTLWLILLTPTDAASPAADWLAVHGPGLFLLSFSAASLDDELARLQAHDIQSTGPKRSGLDDWVVVDLDAEAFGGIAVQLTESTENKGFESDGHE